MLLDSAKQRHVNTDVQRAFFPLLIDVEDLVDGYGSIRPLHLVKGHGRVVVAVMLHGAEHNNTNKFTTEQFIQVSKGARFTEQLVFGDRMCVLEVHHQSARSIGAVPRLAHRDGLC